jgi:type IV pilus assembly protein PilV
LQHVSLNMTKMKINAGFTLVEVLIAMLVLAVGLIGLAGLQAASLGNNQSAYNRSQATQLAYDLADRMRANVAGVATYTPFVGVPTAKPNCLTIVGCTPSDMAENDLFEWNVALTTTLPNGVGTIAVAVVAGVSTFTIDISWDDDRDGNAVTDPHFLTSFQL